MNFLSRKKAKPDFRSELGEFQLPTFPALVLNGLERIRDPEARLGEICDDLVMDPGFTVQILSLVNSAAFGLRSDVRSVHHAASLLGRGKVETLLIALAVRNSLPRKNVPGFDNGRFWATSARRAVTASALADIIDPSTRSASFTASLLQDMALPLLSHNRSEHYGPVLSQWHDGNDDLSMIEKDTFGWDHTEVGSWMCEEWNFPENLAHAIGNHHSDVAGDLPAASLVSCLREVNEGLGIDRLVSAASGSFGIPEEQTRAIVEKSFVEAEDLARLFV